MKRKAQGAIEYLFMIAAALIIVAIVIKYLSGNTGTASEAVKNATSNATQGLKNLTKNMTG